MARYVIEEAGDRIIDTSRREGTGAVIARVAFGTLKEEAQALVDAANRGTLIEQLTAALHEALPHVTCLFEIIPKNRQGTIRHATASIRAALDAAKSAGIA